MAIQDSVVTIKGDQAAVGMLGIAPQADGSILLEVYGKSKDSLGRDVTLKTASMKIQPGNVAAVDNMLVRALSELRKANGLET